MNLFKYGKNLLFIALIVSMFAVSGMSVYADAATGENTAQVETNAALIEASKVKGAYTYDTFKKRRNVVVFQDVKENNPNLKMYQSLYEKGILEAEVKAVVTKEEKIVKNKKTTVTKTVNQYVLDIEKKYDCERSY